MSSLRGQMVKALLASWSISDDATSQEMARQAAERDVGTLLGVVQPELAARDVAIRESSAAYAGLEVRYNAATAMAAVGKRHLERLHAVRAFRGRWAADTLTPQTAGFLDALGVVLDQAADQYCPRCGETASFWHNELCPRCERDLPGEVIDGLRQSLNEQTERANKAEAEIKHLRRQVAAVRRLHFQYRGPSDPDSCAECNKLAGFEIRYPCATIAALEQPPKERL